MGNEPNEEPRTQRLYSECKHPKDWAVCFDCVVVLETKLRERIAAVECERDAAIRAVADSMREELHRQPESKRVAERNDLIGEMAEQITTLTRERDAAVKGCRKWHDLAAEQVESFNAQVRAAGQHPNPLIAELPMKEAPPGPYRYEPTTKLPEIK